MRVEWLPEAVRNLTEQVEWIARQDPWAAVSIGEATEAAVTRLGDHPANVAVYRIEAAAVVILRILHGAQQWPPRP